MQTHKGARRFSPPPPALIALAQQGIEGEGGREGVACACLANRPRGAFLLASYVLRFAWAGHGSLMELIALGASNMHPLTYKHFPSYFGREKVCYTYFVSSKRPNNSVSPTAYL